MQDREPVLTGGCQCGAVRYALYAQPERVHLCHCRMCQKAVGGPFAALAPVRKADFAWTRGKPAGFHSSSIATRDFCADCGTPLAVSDDDSPWTALTLGSLDEPARTPPSANIGTESRLAWLDHVGFLPGSTTESTMPAETAAKLVSHQHPDHDTASWTPHRG